MSGVGDKTMIESMLTLWASTTDEAFAPEALSAELGVSPSKCWKKNDPFPVGTGVRKQGGWRFSSGRQLYSPEGGVDFYSQLSLIKTFLQTHKSQIIASCKRHSLIPELSCVIHLVGGDRPGIGYDQELVVLLAELGAEIDVDIYSFPDEAGETGSVK